MYKNLNPCAKIIRGACRKVLERLGHTDNPLFELALCLEKMALKDKYFVQRKLNSKVDFRTSLGIPRPKFTVMSAIARALGWVAHWQEMISDPMMRISSPRQLHMSAGKRDCVDASRC